MSDLFENHIVGFPTRRLKSSYFDELFYFLSVYTYERVSQIPYEPPYMYQLQILMPSTKYRGCFVICVLCQ